MFLNLFIAIIIDSFLGQTDLQSAPIQQYHVEEFVRLWQKYDPEATGFIEYEQLTALFVDITNSKDARTLCVLNKDQITEPRRKERLIAELEIPLYKKASKVFFYDVLVKLAFSKAYMYFNDDKLIKVEVFGQGGSQDRRKKQEGANDH